MNTEVVFIIIVVFLVADFIVERILEWVNMRAMAPVLPENLKGIYDEKEYARFQNYKRETNRFDLISSTFSFIVMMVFLCTGGFGWWNAWVVTWTDQAVLQTLLFMLGLSLVSGLLGLPFDWYATFHIEEKYGFNKTTMKTYGLDLLKGMLVSGVIGGLLLSAVVWFYEWAGSFFWLYAWGIVSVFSVFMAMFYSQLIVPLFNKQTPLEAGALRDKINAFAEKVGFKLDNIFVIDGSKRSTKANAYFTGFGPRKRIVLYDTLIKDLTEEEIVAVLAHEVGHNKKRHTVQFMLASVIQTGVILWLFSLFVNQPALSMALGGDRACFQLGLIAFTILYSPLSMILGLVMNAWSRKNEYQADAFAARYYDGESLISGLKKISVKSLSNLTPHPLYEWVYYSHPSLLKRIRAIGQIEAVDAVVLGGVVGIVVDAAAGDDGDVAVLAHVEGVVHDVLQARLRHDDGDVHRLALGAVRDADVDAGVVGLGGNVDVGRGMALDQFAVLAHVEGALRHAVHIGDLGEQVLVDGGKINSHDGLLLVQSGGFVQLPRA